MLKSWPFYRFFRGGGFRMTLVQSYLFWISYRLYPWVSWFNRTLKTCKQARLFNHYIRSPCEQTSDYTEPGLTYLPNRLTNGYSRFYMQ